MIERIIRIRNLGRFANYQAQGDVMMRKLSFNELIRREQADTIDSNALKVYVIDKSGLYSKDIQCEAMKVLADRTTRESKGGN